MANFLMLGTISGCIASVSFIIIHKFLIKEIWEILFPALLLGALTGFGLACFYKAKFTSYNNLDLIIIMTYFAIPILLTDLITIIIYKREYTFEQALALDSSIAINKALLPLFPIIIISGIILGKFFLNGDINSYIISFFTCGIILIGIGHNVAILNTIIVNGNIDLIRFKVVEYAQIIVPFISFITTMYLFDYIGIMQTQLE